MAAKSKKRQLENAKQRNNKASREAFFDKLKTTGHDPLPDPTKFKISSVLKPLLVLGVLVLVLFLGYQSLIDSDIGGLGLQNNDSTVSEDTQNQTDANPTESPGDDNKNGADTGEFSVSIRGSIAISEPATIAYGLPLSVPVEDIASMDIELHLIDKEGTYIGYITDLPLSETAFEWNPQVVYQEKGSGVIQSPQQGLYRLIIALRPNDQPDTALSELEQTKISDVFDIEYDESVQESPFPSCFGLGEYSSVAWYSSLTTLLEQRSLSINGQETACYSPEGSLLVIIMNERSERGYPLILRFLIQEDSDTEERENILSEAVYAIPRDQDLTISSVNIGGRRGEIIPIIVNGEAMFSYNFVDNIITAAG